MGSWDRKEVPTSHALEHVGYYRRLTGKKIQIYALKSNQLTTRSQLESPTTVIGTSAELTTTRPSRKQIQLSPVRTTKPGAWYTILSIVSGIWSCLIYGTALNRFSI